MTQAKPIKATFSDFKLVKGRKVAQLVFEVTTDQADEALNSLGGLPRPDAERWFGIVALDLSKAATPAPAEPEKGSRKWEDLAPATQAAIRCQQRDFRKFLGAVDGAEVAERVRAQCGVNSRGDLNTEPEAAARWRTLDDQFQKSQKGFR